VVEELGAALTVWLGNNFGKCSVSVVVYNEDTINVENAVAEFPKIFSKQNGLLYYSRQ
jgi:hypothetical protein